MVGGWFVFATPRLGGAGHKARGGLAYLPLSKREREGVAKVSAPTPPRPPRKRERCGQVPPPRPHRLAKHGGQVGQRGMLKTNLPIPRPSGELTIGCSKNLKSWRHIYRNRWRGGSPDCAYFRQRPVVTVKDPLYLFGGRSKSSISKTSHSSTECVLTLFLSGL